MSAFDWETFLRQWSQAILESMPADQLTQFPKTAIESKWLGYPGATEEQIAQAERRLKLKLPPSYRAFLKVSNGWRQTTPFIRRLWSTEEIECFATRHAKWIEAFTEHHETAHLSFDSTPELDELWEATSVSDQEYFIYGEEQDCSKLRTEYLNTAIEISDVGECAVYLLNPQVVTQDGEWEAWFFGDWLPGADRYPSFRDMMQAEYQNFLELQSAALENKVLAPDAPSQDLIQHQEQAPEALHSPEAVEPLGALRSIAESGVDPTSSTTTTAPWTPAKRLTIEVQTRQTGTRTEYRTLTSSGTGDSLKIWSGVSEPKLRQWIRQQLLEVGISLPVSSVIVPRPEITLSEGVSKPENIVDPPRRSEPESIASPAHTSPAQMFNTIAASNLQHNPVPEAAVPPANPPTPPLSESSVKIPDLTLEIDQVEIWQETRPAAHIVVRPAQMQQQKPGIASLIGKQPFSLEVAFKLVGQSFSQLTAQSITYKAQFYAQNRTTGQWVTLGETRPDTVVSDQQTYTTHLFGNTLEPGIYRLQVLTSLRGAAAALVSFELPFLQVM